MLNKTITTRFIRNYSYLSISSRLRAMSSQTVHSIITEKQKCERRMLGFVNHELRGHPVGLPGRAEDIWEGGPKLYTLIGKGMKYKEHSQKYGLSL